MLGAFDEVYVLDWGLAQSDQASPVIARALPAAQNLHDRSTPPPRTVRRGCTSRWFL
jgi:hypothetical protein